MFFDLSLYLTKQSQNFGVCKVCGTVVPWGRGRVVSHKSRNCVGVSSQELEYFRNLKSEIVKHTPSTRSRGSVLIEGIRPKRERIPASNHIIYNPPSAPRDKRGGFRPGSGRKPRSYFLKKVLDLSPDEPPTITSSISVSGDELKEISCYCEICASKICYLKSDACKKISFNCFDCINRQDGNNETFENFYDDSFITECNSENINQMKNMNCELCLKRLGMAAIDLYSKTDDESDLLTNSICNNCWEKYKLCLGCTSPSDNQRQYRPNDMFPKDQSEYCILSHTNIRALDAYEVYDISNGANATMSEDLLMKISELYKEFLLNVNAKPEMLERFNSPFPQYSLLEDCVQKKSIYLLDRLNNVENREFEITKIQRILVACFTSISFNKLKISGFGISDWLKEEAVVYIDNIVLSDLYSKVNMEFKMICILVKTARNQQLLEQSKAVYEATGDSDLTMCPIWMYRKAPASIKEIRTCIQKDHVEFNDKINNLGFRKCTKKGSEEYNVWKMNINEFIYKVKSRHSPDGYEAWVNGTLEEYFQIQK